MSTHIIGFRPPDEKWKKMKKIYDSCQEADIPVPKEVEEFFNYEEPDASGIEVELEAQRAVTDYRTESRTGFEVDISKLPPDVKILRFFNCW